MSNPSLETIALDSRGVNAAIEALSSAAVSFELKPRQRFIYRTLMASVDLGAAALVFIWLLLLLRKCSAIWWPDNLADSRDVREFVETVATFFFLGSGLFGLAASLLSVPTIKSVLHERERLESLGLDALATSVWRASRKHPVWSSLRGAVLACLGALYALGAVFSIGRWLLKREGITLAIVPLALFLAALFLGARILRAQKEKIELASQAIQLRRALESLQGHVRPDGTVSVPTEFVRQAAMIESAHAAKDRQSAILQNAGKESPGYAIAYQPESLEQRAALQVDERIELEDLLVRLGTTGRAEDGAPVDASAHSKVSRVRTESQRIEVTYTIDEETRTLSIKSLRRVSAEAGAGGAVSSV